MRHCYAIPSDEGGELNVGQWVEIFEAYGNAEGNGDIRVLSMRVAGRLLHFATNDPEGRPLRPHEGQVVSIEKGDETIRFDICLSS